ncbi:MAG: hypothetical protein ACP5PV_05190 [Methanothrix sp.]
MFDLEEYSLFESLIMPIIGVPLIWYGYLWQPKEIDSVLHSFIKNNLIKPQEEKEFKEFITNMKIKIIDKYAIAGGIILSFVFLFMFILVVDPNQADMGTKIPFYYYDWRYYYLFHIPTVFLFTIFPLLMAVITFSWFFFILRKIFSQFEIVIHPLHPDELGGLGQLGRMLTMYVVFLVILGIAMTVLSLVGRPRPFYHSIDVITGYSLYLILILIFVYIIFYIHNYMERFRHKCLFEKLSNSFDIILSNAEKRSLDTNELMNDLESLIKIKNHSDTLKRNYPSWPISIKIRISLLIVNLPLILNAINSFVSSFH